jgi:hypothetical protein
MENSDRPGPLHVERCWNKVTITSRYSSPPWKLGDAVRYDAVRWDAVQWDAVQWDAVQWDAVQWDAVQWDAVQWDAVQWNTPWAKPPVDLPRLPG